MPLIWSPGDPPPASLIEDDALLNAGGHSGILSTFALAWPPALDGGSEQAYASERLFVAVDAYAPGGRTEPHIHPDREKVFVVLDGSLEMTVGDEHRILTSGAFAFVPVGVPHAFANAGDGVLRIAQIIAYLGEGNAG
jgi:mannose-6-phosphate isomerase-like protein (cupin superfamily)